MAVSLPYQNYRCGIRHQEDLTVASSEVRESIPYQVCKCGICYASQLLGVDDYLLAAPACAYSYLIKEYCCFIDKGRELLLHTKRRTPSAYITGKLCKLLEREHLTRLHPSGGRDLLKIKFLICGDTTHDMTLTLALSAWTFEDQRLEYLIGILSQLLGDMHTREVRFINLISSHAVRNSSCLKHAHGIGLSRFMP